jgi:putative DNA primase/helicase
VISGGLEVLDFDENADANFEIFRRDAKSIVCRLPVVESAGGGYHVYYRCNLISGNHKIAQSIDRKQTYVETRGQGGYIIAPGCPAACHPSGNLYLQVMGPPLPQIPTISVADRRSLWEVARQFDERPWHQDLIVQKAKEIKRAMRPAVGSSTNAPWVLMKQSDWRDILEPHGWRSIDGKHWIRPGKKEGTSAIVTPCTDGNNVLVVFSANAGPLSPSTKGHSTWDQFSAFAALNHAGDRKAAAITARRLLNG